MEMREADMKNNLQNRQASDLPDNLSAPARRALVGEGYLRLEQVAAVSEGDLLKLHGLGPKTIRQLRECLAAKGLSFAAGKTSKDIS